MDILVVEGRYRLDTEITHTRGMCETYNSPGLTLLEPDN